VTMPLSPHKAGAADWPPGPNPPAPRGAPDQSDAFAGLLDIQQARTATAEGQNRSADRSRAPRDRDSDRNRDEDRGPVANDRAEARSNAAWAADRREADGVTRGQTAAGRGQGAEADASDAKAKPATAASANKAEAAPATQAVTASAGKPAPTAAVQQLPNTNTNTPTPEHPKTPASEATTTAQQLPADPSVALAQGVASSAATVPAADVSGLEGSATAAAHGGVAAAVVSAVDPKSAQPAGGQVPAADRPLPATPSQQAAPAAPAQTPGSTTTGGKNNTGNARQDLPQQPAAQTAAVPETPRVTRAQPQQVAAPAVQPAGGQPSPLVGGTPAAAPADVRGGFAPATPVPLARAAEAVEHVLQLASQRGVTHARIALHPQELGSIDVHLRSTSEGIVARVVAHAPEAAQQLQQAAADLRKSLEQQGLNLLNLDIGHQDDGRSTGRAGAGTDGSGQGAGGSSAGAGDGDGGDETSTETSLQLPNGVLVDVLA